MPEPAITKYCADTQLQIQIFGDHQVDESYTLFGGQPPEARLIDRNRKNHFEWIPLKARAEIFIFSRMRPRFGSGPIPARRRVMVHFPLAVA
jgi:hypothetical protein